MDHMLASPFNLPSIGTPVHQPEEDQVILPLAQHQQHSLSQPPLQMPPLLPIQNSMSQKPHTYAPSLGYTTPQSMMHPQTPMEAQEAHLTTSLEFFKSLTNHQLELNVKEEIIRRIDTVQLIFSVLKSDNERLRRENEELHKQNIMSPMVNRMDQAANNMINPTTPGPMTPMTPSSADPGFMPQLQNIVSTVNLGCKLDLKRIALHARNAEYNPKRFAAVIMRIREPRTTALIFSSGKMVCTGAKSEDDSRLAARKYARIIQKLGFQAKFLDFKVQNMVGSCDVKFPIRLEGLVLTHGQFSSYEPELFPGLIYRMVKPRIVLLIFVSGKVVLTGAKVRQEIYEAFDNIYPILKSFKKQ